MIESEPNPRTDRPDKACDEGSACQSRSRAGWFTRIAPMVTVLTVVVIAMLWQSEWELAAFGETWPLLALLAGALLLRGKG